MEDRMNLVGTYGQERNPSNFLDKTYDVDMESNMKHAKNPEHYRRILIMLQ